VVWFKVDDGLTSSRKWLSIPKKHRFEALGVWTWAGSWSAKELTDGMIPDFMLNEWGVRKIVKDHLVSAGLWSEVPQNVCHLKWSEYQPMKADVEAEREKNREKLRKWRSRQHADTEVETGSVTGYEPDVNPAPDPTRPDPTLTPSKEGVRAKRATRIPDQFIVNQAMRDWAAKTTPGVNVDNSTAKFVDHWRAKSGKDAAKLDWVATWRNWLRSDYDRVPEGQRKVVKPPALNGPCSHRFVGGWCAECSEREP